MLITHDTLASAMKKRTISLLLFLSAIASVAQTCPHRFLLAGASFAVKENGWFELACEAFQAEPINKAVSGEAIRHTATALFNGVFYTRDELERIDAFIIMHVHEQDVAKTEGIKENYEDYTEQEIQQYHLAYDYVIKKYKADCLRLKDDPRSKYFGTENGKPATLVLCTHWHDSRTTYNTAIRKLAAQWDLPLIKWDENIGFTKNKPDENGKQPSLRFALDTQTQTDGIAYGWHPLRGKEQDIQQKMARICIQELEKIFGPVPNALRIPGKSDPAKTLQTPNDSLGTETTEPKTPDHEI